MGPVLGGVGAASLLCSGYVTDRLSRLDVRWGLWLPALASLVAAPLLAGSFYVTARSLSTLLFGLGYFCALFFSAPATAIIQFLVPVWLRARATAIYVLLVALVGFGVGPSAAGFISVAYQPAFGTESLRFALMSMTPVLIIASMLLIMAARRLPRGT
jgi:hypothetical protein